MQSRQIASETVFKISNATVMSQPGKNSWDPFQQFN